MPRKLFDGDDYLKLLTVKPLKEGECGVREPKSRPLVPTLNVLKTIQHSHKILADMLRVHLSCGSRGQAVRLMRLCDIDFSDPEIWIYTPHKHKMENKKKYHDIPIEPECQAVLLSYIIANEETPEAYLFNPEEAMKMYSNEQRRNRKSKVQPSQQLRKANAPGRKYLPYYTKDAYANAIAKAAERAGVPKWTPHQLRHTKATDIFQEHGIEAARIFLGHDNIETTKIYIDREILRQEHKDTVRENARRILHAKTAKQRE